ncbi:MAG: class I SAM-dependent methyltransferase [Elusimicrobia bacterium]|nr:class I SAM-dependent methyltransferase [Elusimicrobiota bacterium]
MAMILDKAADQMSWMFSRLPYSIRLTYKDQSRSYGSGPERFHALCKSDRAIGALARRDLSDFFDFYVMGEVEFEGDIYAMMESRNFLRDDQLWKVAIRHRLRYWSTYLFPSTVRRKLVAVSSHYDLPNEFIESYLDTKTRAYSCAIWKDPANIAEPYDQTLEDSQDFKHTFAAERLQVQPGDKFLDVGCGYGYMVHKVESEFGCKDALGITLSQNQIETGYSKNLKRMHYLELPSEGQFDKIYTCGMISHLDKSEIRRYYQKLYGLLKSGGKIWTHMISPPCSTAGLTNYNTISGTFSQKYVFPDHYQFPAHVHIRMLEETGFRIKEVYFRYGHYAKTLRHWYKRYVENLPKTRHMITPTIERAWHLYLTYASILDGPHSILKQYLSVKP